MASTHKETGLIIQSLAEASKVWEKEEQKLLKEGIRRFGIKRKDIIHQFGTWVVTKYGLDCLDHYYTIEKERLEEEGWPLHLSGKYWVNMHDFLRAFYEARRLYFPKRYPCLYPHGVIESFRGEQELYAFIDAIVAA